MAIYPEKRTDEQLQATMGFVAPSGAASPITPYMQIPMDAEAVMYAMQCSECWPQHTRCTFIYNGKSLCEQHLAEEKKKWVALLKGR